VQTSLPQLEALQQQALATEQNIALAKSTFIPDLNAGYQVNVATYNNTTGMTTLVMFLLITTGLSLLLTQVIVVFKNGHLTYLSELH